MFDDKSFRIAPNYNLPNGDSFPVTFFFGRTMSYPCNTPGTCWLPKQQQNTLIRNKQLRFVKINARWDKHNVKDIRELLYINNIIVLKLFKVKDTLETKASEASQILSVQWDSMWRWHSEPEILEIGIG